MGAGYRVLREYLAGLHTRVVCDWCWALVRSNIEIEDICVQAIMDRVARVVDIELGEASLRA